MSLPVLWYWKHWIQWKGQGQTVITKNLGGDTNFPHQEPISRMKATSSNRVVLGSSNVHEINHLYFQDLF